MSKDQHAQLLLPGFERIPLLIRADKRRLPLQQATAYALRRYLVEIRKRHRNDPRIAQLKALIKLVRKHGRKVRGMTVEEAMEREAAKGKG